MARAFTSTQGRLLELLLVGEGFDAAAERIGVSKQAMSQALGGLRDHGLIVSEPSRPFRTKKVDPRKDGVVVRWFDAAGVEWVVVTVPIGRYERPDLVPERAVVLLQSPHGEVPMVFSYRYRISYLDVERQLGAPPWPDDHGPGGWDVTVRVVTEMVAKSMGLEALLPAWFLKEDDDNGGKQDDTAD